MGGFFNAIFGGSNPTLNKDTSQEGALDGYSTGVGEGNTTAASTYYQNLLSGDPTKIATSLAPEISAGQQQTQQAKNQMAQFGTRGGGTDAASAAADAQNRSYIINLIGKLQGGAASGAANLGTTNLGMASTDTAEQAALSQQRMQNWLNSILGKGITTGASSAETAGLGAAGM